MLRENKRMLDKAIRDLDRERMGLQNQEKKLVMEIKKTAKQGQMVYIEGLGLGGILHILKKALSTLVMTPWLRMRVMRVQQCSRGTKRTRSFS